MYKLLLVDDEAIIREGIRTMVDWEALDIVLTASCANAFAALDSMTDDMPDILMTDVRMPGMSGLELTERALQLHPQLQTLILSGYSEFDYARQAMKWGVKEYLLKPCSREEMEEALTRTCRLIDRQRQHVLQLTGERQEHVRMLAEKLSSLRAGYLDSAALERQISELARTTPDPSAMREALFRVVTGGAPAGWGFTVIQEALAQPEQLVPLTVRTLLRLREESGDMRGFVQRMAAYIDEHYGDEALSLQHMADNVVFMNADYIGREFARCMGEKFSAYLLKVRMEHAKAMMNAAPDMRSYEIAERVGLGNNPHYFSQLFRKYTGLTPTEYRGQMDRMTEN